VDAEIDPMRYYLETGQEPGLDLRYMAEGGKGPRGERRKMLLECAADAFDALSLVASKVQRVAWDKTYSADRLHEDLERFLMDLGYIRSGSTDSFSANR